MFSLLIAASLKSIPILAAAWMITFAMRRRSAAARHLVWTAAAIALLALPFLSLSLPHWSIPGAIVLEPATFTAASVASHDAYASDLYPAPPPSALARFDWQRALALLWLVGAALGLLRIALAYVSIWRIRRGAVPLEDRSQIASLAASLGIERRVEVYLIDPGSMPMTAGVLHPAVFLPQDSREWSDDRRNLVLLHELAHVRRADPALHLIARTALTLYWWNPLAWLAWREFLKERERAADDLVLTAGARASDYAGHLLEIARALRVSALAGLAAIAMARKSQLEGRLMAILDSKIRRQHPRFGASIAVAAAILLAAPIAAIHAQEQRTPQPAAASPAENLLKLGQAEVMAKNNVQAIEYFERAALADARLAGQAFLWEAIANDRGGRPEEAESLFKSALSRQDPGSLDYAITEKVYAQFLRAHARGEESTALDSSADSIQKGLSAGAPLQAGVYRIGNGVTQPKIVLKTEPMYTEEARIARLQGQVQLTVTVGIDGTAQDVRVSRPLGLGLDEQAVQAVSHWRFLPGMKDGEPVPVFATVEVNFRLL